jgi:hypothetical protein
LHWQDTQDRIVHIVLQVDGGRLATLNHVLGSKPEGSGDGGHATVKVQSWFVMVMTAIVVGAMVVSVTMMIAMEVIAMLGTVTVVAEMVVTAMLVIVMVVTVNMVTATTVTITRDTSKVQAGYRDSLGEGNTATRRQSAKRGL